MKAAVKQRARIARVRRLQHGLAASSAAAAMAEVRNLEVSSSRLAQMRGDLNPDEGMTSGAWLSSAGELAMRLDSARIGLAPTIDAARSAAQLKEQARLAARQNQESAERLEQAAANAVEQMFETRMNKITRRRARPRNDEVKP